MAEETDTIRRIIIISGLSGAGKSLVLNTLEDQGFFCIDNLPISLFSDFSLLLGNADNNFPLNIGVGIDARSPEEELSILPDCISALKDKNISVELVFLEASKNVLTARFSETRRKHPLSTQEIPLSGAIDKEREILGLLSDIADVHIDTTHTAVHELRNIVRDRLAHKPAGALSLQFISFGYKHGVPGDADFLFDVRCLPNPYWEKNLREFSGKDQEVIDFLRDHDSVTGMFDGISGFLMRWVPAFEAENRSYLSIGIGCTGGRHRSVYIVERLARHFEESGKYVVTRHRDL